MELGFIDLIIGIVIGHAITLYTSIRNRKHEVSLTLLQKRMDIHQETYLIFRELVKQCRFMGGIIIMTPISPLTEVAGSNIQKVIDANRKSAEWFNNNFVYFTRDLKKRVQKILKLSDEYILSMMLVEKDYTGSNKISAEEFQKRKERILREMDKMLKKIGGVVVKDIYLKSDT